MRISDWSSDVCSSDLPTYRASLGYQATDDLFVYATYSHGFKAGAFNDQIGSFAPFGNDLDAFALAASATDPEKADSSVAGVKSAFLDRRWRWTVTGFWVGHRELQKLSMVTVEVTRIPCTTTRIFIMDSTNAKVQTP